MKLSKKEKNLIKKIRKEISKTEMFPEKLAGSCGLASFMFAKKIKGAKCFGTEGFSHVWIEYKGSLLDITYSQTSTKKRKSVLFIPKSSKTYVNYKKEFPKRFKYSFKQAKKDYNWILKQFPNIS